MTRDVLAFLFYMAVFVAFAIGAYVDYNLTIPEGLTIPPNLALRNSYGGRAKYLTILNLVKKTRFEEKRFRIFF